MLKAQHSFSIVIIQYSIEIFIMQDVFTMLFWSLWSLTSMSPFTFIILKVVEGHFPCFMDNEYVIKIVIFLSKDNSLCGLKKQIIS